MNREAILGLVVWIALLVVAPWFLGIDTVERFFLFALLVIVPLGFSLLSKVGADRKDSLWLERAIQVQPVAALILVPSFLFEAGVIEALLTLPWMIVCLLAALHGVTGLRQRGVRFESIVGLFATAYLLVGSGWLFASRAGMNPAGFQEPIVLLTAVHFHYSGFAAVLLTARVAARCASHPVLAIFGRTSCIGTILAMALIAVGFVVSLPLKVVAVFVLAACLTGAALLTVWLSTEMRVAAARNRLRISSVAVLAGMALAALYAIGEYTGHVSINLNEMAISHGALNSLGFSFCGLWGWNLLAAKEAL